mgnify:CR=1 FL=1
MRSEREILTDCREAACEVWSAIAPDIEGIDEDDSEFVAEMVFDCDRIYRFNEWLPDDAIARLKTMGTSEKQEICKGIA